MTKLLHVQTRFAAFAGACFMALFVNGAVVLGADQLARGADAATAAARVSATVATIQAGAEI